MRKYGQLQEMCDFVLCEGTDFASSTAAFELDINAEISKNLGSSVLLVANAYKRTVENTLRSIELTLDSLNGKGCQTIAAIINRVDSEDGERLIRGLKEEDFAKEQLIYTIPEEEALGKPTVGEIAEALGAEVLY